jgi:Zn finger protein HypA/HybF involved in hydrogenase expression
MSLESFLHRVQAIAIEEVTTRYLCGKCGALVKSKETSLPVCKKCGTMNEVPKK